ncbi:MAG: PadR family transcriptional regulator [Marmoricola sp.]
MGQDQFSSLPVTAYALLGLLTFGDELTGYELKQRADNTLRYYWTSPAMSQVYSELGRLQGHGLVEAVGPRQSERPTRYRMTRAGRARLRAWMTNEPAGFPVLKHPVALKLLMGHVVDVDTTIAMLEEYLEELARNRTDLQGVRDSLVGGDGIGEPFRNPALVADWGLAYYDSEAETTEKTLARLREES